MHRLNQHSKTDIFKVQIENAACCGNLNKLRPANSVICIYQGNYNGFWLFGDLLTKMYILTMLNLFKIHDDRQYHRKASYTLKWVWFHSIFLFCNLYAWIPKWWHKIDCIGFHLMNFYTINWNWKEMYFFYNIWQIRLKFMSFNERVKCLQQSKFYFFIFCLSSLQNTNFKSKEKTPLNFSVFGF